MIFKDRNHRAMRSNLVMTLADIMESEMVEMRGDLRYDGIKLAYEPKKYYNEALHGLRMFRHIVVGHISEEQQYIFGERADVLRYVTWLLTDRMGSEEDWHKVIDSLEAMPSKRGIDTDAIKHELFND